MAKLGAKPVLTAKAKLTRGTEKLSNSGQLILLDAYEDRHREDVEYIR